MNPKANPTEINPGRVVGRSDPHFRPSKGLRLPSAPPNSPTRLREDPNILNGLLLVSLVLLGYGVVITVRVVSVEKRVSRLEASHQELQWRYRIYSNTLAHVQMTPELTKSLQAALAEEGRRQPNTSRGLRLLGTEFNSPPADVSSR